MKPNWPLRIAALLIILGCIVYFGTATAEAQKVQALLILLQNDEKDIRDTVDVNQQTWVDELLPLVSKHCEVKVTLMKSLPGLAGELTEITLEDSTVTARKVENLLNIVNPAQVTEWLDRVQTGPMDTLLIYFSGHGEMDRYGTTHRLLLDPRGENFVTRKQIMKPLKKKQARLKMLITDTCSEIIEMDVSAQAQTVNFARIKSARYYAKNLFLDHAGLLDLTAASPGKLAYGNPTIGSYFTHAIAESLDPASDTSGDDFLSWQEVFASATKTTRKLCEQVPLFQATNTIQIPIAHEIPEEERLDMGAQDSAGMVLIPACEFQMGSNDGGDNEKPVHTVYVDAFYMDVYEVTNAQFKAFVDANPQWRKNQIPSNYHDGDYLKPWSGNSYPSGKGNHPVVYVSWYAAMAYAQWVGKRLPTEAEWEKAARGGLQGQTYPWGNGIDANKANYNGNVDSTTPVGSYGANGYGLHDMAGNVWEWCLDAYDGDFYARSPRQNPLAGEMTLREMSASYRNVTTSRVRRGGGWGNTAQDQRVATRNDVTPTGTYGIIGFRCARAVTP